MGRRRQPQGPAGLLVLLCLLAGGGRPAGAAMPWSTGGWLTAAAGRESDLTIVPGPQPEVVPGGPFVAVIAGASARGGLTRRTRLELGGQAWYEGFTDAAGRTLFSATLAADLHLALNRDWALRFGGGGHHFDDSARSTARREAGWGEAGLVWQPGPWRVEIQGGGEALRYPRLQAPDDAGVYTEHRAVAGAHLSLRTGRRAILRAAGHQRWTEANDPYYTCDGPTLEAGAEVLLAAGLRLVLDGFFQERTFPARAPGLDQDRYGQVGAGLDLDLGPHWLLRFTAAFSRYTWPDGQAVDTDRYQLAATWRFGSAGRRTLPAPGHLPRVDAPDQPRAGRPVRFRVHLPGADAVALVGDFNGWDRAARPLERAGDGWWETTLELPAGTHAYAYVVDGAWLTPPEAAATEGDGFGGRNGLLVVLP